jgi:hypothetical protein
MNGYHVDWVGAISTGAAAIIVFAFIKTAFPRLIGARFYLLLGLLMAAFSLALRELLRVVGI